MLKFVTGNLFDSQAQAFVNTVNCVGVMGKGIALAFKERFPTMFEDYRARCERDEIQPGVLTIYRDDHPWVINFPTKRHWRANSRLEDIELGLISLVRNCPVWALQSLALPALGCGHGGLRWSDVRPLIEHYLEGIETDIEVYEPGAGPQVPTLRTAELVQALDLFGNPIAEKTVRSRRKRKNSGRNGHNSHMQGDHN